MVARLPAHREDPYHAILDEFLLTSLNPDGTPKIGILNYALGSAASAGATVVGCERPPPVGLDSSQIVAIDPFSTICEVKTVTSVSGSALSFSTALKFAHSAGAQVLFLSQRTVPAPWFGAKGDGSTNDHAALVHAADECGREVVALDGMNKQYMIALPWTVVGSPHFLNFEIERHSAYAPLTPVDPSGAMLMNGTTAKAFTATASDDTFEFASAHGLAVTNGVVMYGSSLPAGITQGKLYWVIQVLDSTRLKLSATPTGSAVNLTTNGSGEARVDVYNGGGRLNLENFRLDGNAGDVNGVLLNGTQPGFWWKPYIENCNGWGVRLRGQDYSFWNTVVLRCGRGIVMDGMSMSRWYQTNVESLDIAGTDKIGIDFTANDGLHTATGNSLGHRFWGLHFENCKGSDIRMAQGGAWFAGIDTNRDGDSPLLTCTGTVQNTWYRLTDVWWWSDSDTMVAIDDSARGWTGADALLVRADFGRRIDDFISPCDISGIPSRPSTMWAGPGKGYHRVGSSALDQPQIEDRIPSGQTADFYRLLNSAGAEKLALTSAGELQLSDGPRLIAGAGSPEGAATAPVGSIFLRSDGGASTTLYVKQSGAGNTGWVAK